MSHDPATGTDESASAPAPTGAAEAAGLAGPDIARALQLFDETTRALEARSRRLEEVLTVKQRELMAANQALADKVAELDRLHAYVNLVLDAAASGVVAVAADGRITTCNPAARAALGELLPADPIGADYHTLADPAPCWEVLATGAPVGPYEWELPAVGQGRRVLAGRAAPLRDGDGELIGFVEVFEDVTELRGLQDRLQRAERLKALGEMAAGVAHEIRNPLNGIEGFASLLARDLGPEAGGQRYVRAIIDGVRHLNTTVSGLLEFTQPRPPQCTAVPPVALVENCLELVRAQAAAGDGPADRSGEQRRLRLPELALVDEWRGDRVHCDGGQLRQVLLNLVQNACQILEEQEVDSPRVRVTVAGPDDGQCHWIVEDNGPGVPEADRQTIFMPFHTGRERGTGLGLAIAHNLVQLHGGSLTVDASALGGARFRVAVPER